jgi:hypothetical protein
MCVNKLFNLLFVSHWGNMPAPCYLIFKIPMVTTTLLLVYGHMQFAENVQTRKPLHLPFLQSKAKLSRLESRLSNFDKSTSDSKGK